MNESCLINLIVAPEVEGPLTDWLLAQDMVSGFSSHPIAGHGSSEHSMTLAEQVVGKRRQVLFQLHMPCTDAREMVTRIRSQFVGSGMHYWLQPVLESGHLG